MNARIVVFDLQNTAPALLEPVADSASETDSSDVENDPVAFDAIQGLTLARGTVSRGGQTYAEVAYPLGGSVVLLSASMHDQLQVVSVVRRRVFIAGATGDGLRGPAGLRGRERLRAADPPPRARRRPDRRRALRRACRRSRLGRGRPARPLLRADAPAPRAPRPGPGRVHRQRLARAAHAPLLARRLPGAAGRPGLDEGTRDEFLAQMREQVDRLAKLATDLLDLSRLDAGRLAVTTEPIDLGELVDDLGAEFRARAATVSHPLDVAREDGVVALGDTERARQIGRILRRERARAHAGRHDGAGQQRPRRQSRHPDGGQRRARASRATPSSRSSSASTGSTAAAPRAAASAWRSRASWPR